MDNSKPKIKPAVPRPNRQMPLPQSQNEAVYLRRPRRMMPRCRQPRLPAMEYRLVSLFEE